jgi:hypothetical protein
MQDVRLLLAGAASRMATAAAQGKGVLVQEALAACMESRKPSLDLLAADDALRPVVTRFGCFCRVPQAAGKADLVGGAALTSIVNTLAAQLAGAEGAAIAEAEVTPLRVYGFFLPPEHRVAAGELIRRADQAGGGYAPAGPGGRGGGERKRRRGAAHDAAAEAAKMFAN